MAYNPTTWKDQIVTDPTKYKITKENGAEELVNIEKVPGEIIQEGTRITADKLNNIEHGIKGTADLVNDLAGAGRTEATVKKNADDIGGLSTQMANLEKNVKKNKYDGTRVPTATDDETEGYSIGSMWFFNNSFWICVDSTTGTAIWISNPNFTDMSLVYYNEGEENQLITGGWDIGGYMSNGTTTKRPQYLEAHVYEHNSNTTGWRTFITTNKIDLTGVNKLKVDWEKVAISHPNSKAFISVFTSTTNQNYYYHDAYTLANGDIFTRRYDYLDVSNLNGEYYIIVGADGGANVAVVEAHVKIYGIWGEL